MTAEIVAVLRAHKNSDFASTVLPATQGNTLANISGIVVIRAQSYVPRRSD